MDEEVGVGGEGARGVGEGQKWLCDGENGSGHGQLSEQSGRMRFLSKIASGPLKREN